jgi:hypothetical protein
LLRPGSAPGTGQSVPTLAGAVGVPSGVCESICVGLPDDAVSVVEDVPSRSVPEAVWTSVGLADRVGVATGEGVSVGGSVPFGFSALVQPATATAPILASSARRDQRSCIREQSTYRDKCLVNAQIVV